MEVGLVKKLLSFVVVSTLAASAYSAHSGYDIIDLMSEITSQKLKQLCDKPAEKVTTQYDINLKLYNAANKGNYKKVGADT